MRRQPMQYSFIFLIMVVSIILKFSSSSSNAHAEQNIGPPRGGTKQQPGNSSGKHTAPTPQPMPPVHTPTPTPHPTPTPPTPTPPPPPTLPPPSPEPVANEMASQKKVGKFVGLLFLGIAGVLQVGAVSFLVFKRWQIPRIQDETGVRLVS